MAKAVREKKFAELDQTIRESLLDFVRCGRALREMRDSQVYLDAKFKTFEDYLKVIEGISIKVAKEKIRHAIVVDALSTAAQNCAPVRTESQVRALANAAVFDEKTEVRQQPNGQKVTIKQPVAVKNPNRLKQVWESAVKAHEQKVVKAIQEGKPKPKLTASLIIDHLPNDKKPQHILKRKMTTTCQRITVKLGTISELLEQFTVAKLEKLCQQEEWNDAHLHQLELELGTLREQLGKLDAVIEAAKV